MDVSSNATSAIGVTAMKECPMCGQRHGIKLSDEESRAYQMYMSHIGLLQNLFLALNPVEREFIKTGYCPHCQELLFGNGRTSRVFKYEGGVSDGERI